MKEGRAYIAFGTLVFQGDNVMALHHATRLEGATTTLSQRLSILQMTISLLMKLESRLTSGRETKKIDSLGPPSNY